MKKLLLSVFLAVAALTGLKAQIQAGNVLAGANLSNISLGLDEPNVFSLNINPKAAWFIMDGLAVGADVNFGLNTAKDAGTDFNYGIGALARSYSSRGANEVVNNSMFFAEATLGISGVNPSVGETTNGLGFSAGPGFTYFITRSIGLEALLKYNGVVGFGSSPYAHNLSLGVGFQVYLPGRRTAARIERDID